MLSVRSRYVVFVLFMLTFGCLQAQINTGAIRPKINSPYSRFGLGDLLDQPFASSAGMAGLTAAYQDAFHVNVLNPASLAYLQATAFELGFYARYANLQSNTQEPTSIWSGNLNYISLGFPIKNPINKILDRDQTPFGWGMNLALLPYSLVGYNVGNTEMKEDLGQITNTLKGTGGTYRLYWGNGVRYGNMAFGVNIGYQFGKITNSRNVQFDSLSVAYQTELLDEISVSGFIWNVGAQYTIDFKKTDDEGEKVSSGHKIILGAYGNSTSSFTTNSSRFYHRDNFTYGEVDTIISEIDIIQSGTMPSEWTFGLAYERLNKMRLGLEYTTSNWSKYENEAKPESLTNAYRIAFGGEIIPDIISYNNYFRRVRYRFGAFYGTDPRTIDGAQLKEYGVTFGAGLPIILPRQQTSFVNLALEVGRYGLADALRETYFKMTLGFTLNDNTWFFKRKFN